MKTSAHRTPRFTRRDPLRLALQGGAAGWPRRLAVAACVMAAGALSACASYGPGGLAPGSTPAQAVASMGPSTGRYALPGGGERLEFARGPMGKHTYMLDYDAQGRLQRSEQVLTEANFLALQMGMSQDDVRQRIGRPSDVSELTWQRQQLWSYRYETPFCLWFQVSLDTTGHVVGLGHNVDPMCDSGDRSDH